MKEQKRFEVVIDRKGCGAWGGATTTTTRLAQAGR
jgi:hypothetical protein